jgi:high affinity Mn2+ porin
MKRICIIGSTTSVVLATCPFAAAADLPASIPIKAPVRAAIYNWTGFYVGGQVGYGGGSFGPGTNPIPDQAVFFPTASRA